MSWVLEHSLATGHARLVLIAIANHADAEGTQAWPAVNRLAQEAGCSRATVFRCIQGLKEIGELDWEPGGGRTRSNYYWMPAFRNSLNLRPIPEKTVSSVAVNRLKREINSLTRETRTVLKNRPIEPRAISHRMKDVTTERLQREGKL